MPSVSPGNKIEILGNGNAISRAAGAAKQSLGTSKNKVLYCSEYSNVETDKKQGSGRWVRTLILLTHFNLGLKNPMQSLKGRLESEVHEGKEHLACSRIRSLLYKSIDNQTREKHTLYFTYD